MNLFKVRKLIQGSNMKKYFLLLFILTSSTILAQLDYQMIIQGTSENPAMNPIYSPDGSKIAYTQQNYKGIWIFDLNEKASYQLTDEEAAGFGYKWSSDSKSILTRVAKYDNQKRFNAVKIFDVDTKSSKQLTDYKTMMPYLPNWIDGDSKILLPSKNEDEVFNFSVEKKSSSNNMIAFERNNKIIVKDINKNAEISLTPFTEVQYLNISISPDYSKIVFEVLGGNMFVMNVDGTTILDLGKGNRPRWSADSKKIIYIITEDNGNEITSSDIYIINNDGSLKTNITNTEELIEMNPCFSPDGKSIVFDLINNGSIYLMNLE